MVQNTQVLIHIIDPPVIDDVMITVDEIRLARAVFSNLKINVCTIVCTYAGKDVVKSLRNDLPTNVVAGIASLNRCASDRPVFWVADEKVWRVIVEAKKILTLGYDT